MGDANYYDKYGEKLGEASRAIEGRITAKIKSSDAVLDEVRNLHASLKTVINDAVTQDDAVRVMAQHLVLSRVFDAMFQGEFQSHNPISVALDGVAKKVGLDEELEGLEDFYSEAQSELSEVTTREARQNFIKKIYENFFKSVSKNETEQHGVVYTPVEIVDFIIKSIEHVLREEFGRGLDSKDVKILDPFAGTGTFISRVLESGLIRENMYEKYLKDMHANELILLAYYIATVNIETTYSSLNNMKYVPFEGIAYTDTLQQDPRYLEDPSHRQKTVTLDNAFIGAYKRVTRQNQSCIDVIMGNPPYSRGQQNANDDNPNVKHSYVDKLIRNTYVQAARRLGHTGNVNSLYDSYIRSLRWASDRIGEHGVIGFVTNGSFIRSDATAGIRYHLHEEFTDVWCFDLRGNQRTMGEISRKEGGKIFGSGSRAPITIIILVRNPARTTHHIHYKDIGNYHNREKKLDIIRNTGSINGIEDWQAITPDKHHNWLDQPGEAGSQFEKYIPIGDSDTKGNKAETGIFRMYSLGLASHRDVWVYNSSITELEKNVKRHIGYCNTQYPDNFIIDPKQAKTSPLLIERLKRVRKISFNRRYIRTALYRPLFKQQLYYDDVCIEMRYRTHLFFPNDGSENLVIMVPYKFIGRLSTFITDVTPDLHVINQNQCFPLYTYDKDGRRHDNITDHTVRIFRKYYRDDSISRKDIFYYVYGLLHHPGYITKYQNSLARMLPRIPIAPDFQTFSKAGKELADLHLNYESCPRYGLGEPKNQIKNFAKMSFGKDRTTIRINGLDMFDNIPKIAYRVNGRTPLEWVVDRYRFTTDRDSGITNNPCEGADPIALIERAVYVGVESDKIINELSGKEFESDDWEPLKTGLDAY